MKDKQLKEETISTDTWVKETIKTYGNLIFKDSNTQWACLFLTLSKLKGRRIETIKEKNKEELGTRSLKGVRSK